MPQQLRVMRSSWYRSETDRNPLTVTVREADLPVSLEQAIAARRKFEAEFKSGSAGLFVVNDIFEVAEYTYCDPVRISRVGALRLDDSARLNDELTMARYFYRVAAELTRRHTDVYIDLVPTSLTVAQVMYVLEALENHPDYHGHSITLISHTGHKISIGR